MPNISKFFDIGSIQNRLQLGPLGVYSYIFLFTIPFEMDIALIVLAFTSFVTSIFFPTKNSYNYRSPMILQVLIFLLITIISILLSENIMYSLRLSVALLPGLLLFFLIIHCFSNIQQLYVLFLVLSILSIGVSLVLIKSVYEIGAATPAVWINHAKSSIFVVPNDVTFFALLVPFSISLLFLKKNWIPKLIAVISILLCIWIIHIFQSRVAILTLFTTIITFLGVIRPKVCIRFCLCAAVLILLLDACSGFPVIMKFSRIQDQRIAIWLSAFAIFKEAPLFGHGPHLFGLLYSDYLKALNLPSWFLIDNRIMPWAHNLYLEILAEQGITGLITLLGIMAQAFYISWKEKEDNRQDIHIFYMGSASALIGFCVGAFFELTFLRQWVVFIFFLIMGIISCLSLLSEQTKENARYVGNRSKS